MLSSVRFEAGVFGIDRVILVVDFRHRYIKKPKVSKADTSRRPRFISLDWDFNRLEVLVLVGLSLSSSNPSIESYSKRVVHGIGFDQKYMSWAEESLR